MLSPSRQASRFENRPACPDRGLAHGPEGVPKEQGLSDKDQGVGLLNEGSDAPFLEVEELRALVVEGRERGYLTFEEIAAFLEEVEVTKEQVRDFHLHLLDNGAASRPPATPPAHPGRRPRPSGPRST
jgi:hypothetical protein